MNETYINDACFFLTVGEQAPFKSPAEVENLTISQVKYWVSKLSEMYEKQREAMNKANKK